MPQAEVLKQRTVRVLTLTASVPESGDGGGCEADAAEKPGPLLAVDLAMIPHTHSNRVRATEKSGNGG